VLLGVVSSLVAFPVYEVEALVGERPEWYRLRERHLREVRSALAALERRQRVVLFCHDPTAIPFLWEQAGLRDRVEQVACTVIGHLHTPLVLRASRMLAGMPTVRFLGNAVRRMTTALREARRWRTFRVVLCPSLSGCQLLKDGGFGALELAADGASHAWRTHHLSW
jgi:hypothetical protein